MKLLQPSNALHSRDFDRLLTTPNPQIPYFGFATNVTGFIRDRMSLRNTSRNIARWGIESIDRGTHIVGWIRVNLS